MLTRIGKFEIVRKLGEGAMGEVYLAKDTVIGREVAVKTIHPHGATAADARDRFFREAQAAGRLNHPNLVTVHEFGEDAGLLFLAMEYVPGEDLTALLRGGLAPGEILEVVAQVCEGLGFAHQHGVLHRDVKPSNVRVTRISGRPLAKVMDFGIARVAGSEMTGTGTLLGTFGYMAPEYIQSGKPDARSDLFAAGVILYEALAGHKPFEGDTTATILYRVIHEDPPALEPGRIAGISPAIHALLKRALAKDPAARFQTGEAMAAALRSARNPQWSGPVDLEATVRAAKGDLPTTRIAVANRPRRTWPWLAALALVAVGVGGWLFSRKEIPRAATAPAALPPGRTAPPSVEPPPAPESLLPKPQEVRVAPPSPEPMERPRPEPKPEPRREPKPEPLPPPKIQTLEEASAAIDTDPDAALAFLETHVAEDPSSERGHALRIAALYQLGRYDDCLRAFREAAKNGFRVQQMARFPRFRQVIEAEKADPKLAKRLKPIMEWEQNRPNRRRVP
jgi:serine/threonine-protein kinase